MIMEVEAGELPPGPMVKMCVDDERLLVLIEPPLPNGDQHSRQFLRHDRDFAWQYAKALWVRWRIGFKDETEGNSGRIGPNRRTTDR
jgi:hypothetical protein